MQRHPVPNRAHIRPIATVVILGLLLIPLAALPMPATAAASGPDAIAIVHVEPFRVGDRITYAGATSAPGTEVLVVVSGPGVARDAWGREQSVESYAWAAYSEGSISRAYACHFTPGTTHVVRRDIMDSADGKNGKPGRDIGGTQVFPVRITDWDYAPIADFPGDCMIAYRGWSPLAGATLREGDEVPAGQLYPGAVDHLTANRSLPAAAVRVHDRAALALRFVENPPDDAEAPDAPGARYVRTFTVADGLPGIASETRGWIDGNGTVLTSFSEYGMVGYAVGSGPVVRTGVAEGVGTGMADIARDGIDAMAPDTEGLGISFPFEEAYRVLDQDPLINLRGFLESHPDAVLTQATYDRYMQVKIPPRGTVNPEDVPESDGGWQLTYRDTQDSLTVQTVRMRGVRTPLGPVTDPSGEGKAYDNDVIDRTYVALPLPAPATVATGAALVEVARGHGVSVDLVESYSRVLGVVEDEAGSYETRITYAISDIAVGNEAGENGRAEGTWVILDGETAAARVVFSIVRDTTWTGPLAGNGRTIPPAVEDPAPSLNALGAPVSRGTGMTAATPYVVIGASAAAGVLILLIAKAALGALYTRLATGNLLAHPVRATLHDRIRRDPGVHLSVLESASGMGKGATRHHLDHLVKGGYLTARRDGGFLRYFAVGALTPDAARRETILRAGSNRRVHDLLVEEPGLSLREIADRLGMSAPSVHRARKRLVSEGLIPVRSEAQAEP